MAFVAATEPAEQAVGVLQALGSLRHGPWWPGLDEMIESARTFYPGRLAAEKAGYPGRLAAEKAGYPGRLAAEKAGHPGRLAAAKAGYPGHLAAAKAG